MLIVVMLPFEDIFICFVIDRTVFLDSHTPTYIRYEAILPPAKTILHKTTYYLHAYKGKIKTKCAIDRLQLCYAYYLFS